jgi:uncharacterized protein
VVTVDIPMTLHIDQAPDDKQVQAAMYGPLVLAVRQGTEGLTTAMIYGDSGPWESDEGYPMPTVKLRTTTAQSGDSAIWFERVEGSRHYPLQFRSKGDGPIHTLVPLNLITDERYSVYVRNEGVA